jgi:ferrous-iron efflux pump FieF
MLQPINPFDFKNVKPEDALLRASAFSVATAVVLILIKSIAYWRSDSLSVLAALTDSGLDLLASLVTFFAVRFAKKPPDTEHPFGHGKAEAFSALFQAGLVFASAALIGRDAFLHLFEPKPIRQEAWAIGVLIISIILTLMLVIIQTKALKASASVAISADRAHYYVDLSSNSVALLGVVLASFGWLFFDALAALAVVCFLVWGAVGVLREAADHLMDRSMSPPDVDLIAALVLKDPQIFDVHGLRTRIAGPFVLIQMHIDLDPHQSLDAAHKLVIAAEKRVLEAFPNADILIHPDPKGMAEPHGGVFDTATSR